MLPDPLGLFRRNPAQDLELPDAAPVQQQWRQTWAGRGVDPDVIEYAVKLAEGRAKATAKQGHAKVQDIINRSVLAGEYQLAARWVRRMLECSRVLDPL